MSAAVAAALPAPLMCAVLLPNLVAAELAPSEIAVELKARSRRRVRVGVGMGRRVLPEVGHSRLGRLAWRDGEAGEATNDSVGASVHAARLLPLLSTA